MPKQIWKFILDTADVQHISMPEGAEILTLKMQGENACIWALVDPDAKKKVRTFHIYGTGHTLRKVTLKYIGTYQLRNGSLIFHLFEH